MKIPAVLAIIIIYTLAGLSGEAQAIERSKPVLKISENDNLCQPFFHAWQEIFEEKGPINITTAELEKYFPRAKIISFPDEKTSGLCGEGYFFEVDLNGDKKPETLYLGSSDVGWRCLGVDLFLVDDLKKLEAIFGPNFKNSKIRALDADNEEMQSSLRKIYSYDPAGHVHFIIQDGVVYTLSIPREPKEDTSASVEFVAINSEGAHKVCEADLLPAKRKYEEFFKENPLLDGFKNVYGDSHGAMCLGSMGWAASPLDYSLSYIFERPYVLSKQEENLPKWIEPWHVSDIATQLRYISWAVSDPIGWQAYQSVEKAKPYFIQYIQNYYVKNFQYSEPDAREKAMVAWKYWQNNVIYAHTSDDYKITLAAKYLPDKEFSSTQDLVDQAFDVLIKEDISNYMQQTIFSDVLLALIYTRGHSDKILKAYELIEPLKNNSKNSVGLASINKAYIDTINKALLAAIGNSKLMQMSIDHGADVNAGTNEFQKTPLMYAAQLNDIESVNFLIKSGANVSSKTGIIKGSCVYLERDYRTPLMYAAENANKDVISFLIDSGADVSAEDSKGNTAAWYFDKNVMVKDLEDRHEIEGLLTKYGENSPENKKRPY